MANFLITSSVNIDSLVKLGSVAALAWTRVTTTATVTQANHGMIIGDLFNVTVTSDAAAITVAVKTLTAVTANTFSFVCLNAGAASGTVTGNPINNYRINGGYLTIDSHSRYGVNQNTYGAMGNIIPSATFGGSVEFNSTLIRSIAYDTGSGNVPALDTAITLGGASGKLLGVYSALNVAPTTAGNAMPASGYILVRQWNGVAYAAGALGGIAASATAADRAGWLEIVGCDGLTATINRLNTFKVRGAWYDFQGVTTTGTRTTGYQIPSHGSAVNYFPGVWVSTAADKTITAASWAAGAATYTAATHGFVAGQFVTVSGVTPTGYNVDTVKITSVTTNTFTLPLTADPGTWSSGGLAYAFEFYPCQGTLAATITNMATDAVRGKFCWIVPATGIVYFGYDGTNQTGGYCPPSGRRVQIPNIFFLTCTQAAPTVNILPNATLATRYKFATTLAGVIDIDKCCMNWQATFQQPFSVALTNIAIMTQLTVSEIASPIAWSHVGVGQEAANTQIGFSMVLCVAGGTMSYCTWTRASAIATNTVTLTDVTGLTITYERTCNILLRTGAALTHSMTRVGTSTWAYTTLGNGTSTLSTCNDVTFTNTTFYSDPGGALQQTTAAANPLFIWSLLLSCVRVIFDGVDFGGLALVQPYSGIVNLGLAGNSAIKLRNVGTYASPLDMGGPMVSGTFTQATTTVTCTKASHGLKIGDIIYVYSVTAGGTFTVGSKTIVTVPTVNTFTITSTTGTAGSPLPFDYYPTMTAQLANIVAAHNGSNITIQRCYAPHLRTNLIVVGDNSNKGLTLESVMGDYINAPTSITLNQKYKQIRATHPLAIQNSVYGTHWLDYYTTGIPANTAAVSWTRTTTTATVTSAAHELRTGDLINVSVTSSAAAIILGQKSITVLTTDTFTFTCLNAGAASGTLTFTALHGRIALTMNEATAESTTEAVLSNGAAFTSAGALYMPNLNHQTEFTSSANIIGHTGFPIAEAVMGTAVLGNYDIDYSLDSGATYKNLSYPRFVTPFTVNAVATTYTQTVKLNATQCLIVYGGVSTFLQACIVQTVGGQIKMGPVFTVNAFASTWISVTRMTDTRAIVTWIDNTFVNACILDVNGIDITAGTTLVVNAAASLYTSVTRMSDTQAIVTYRGVSNYCNACTLNVSGTTLTNGTVLAVNAVVVTYTAVVALTSTKAVVVYSGAANMWAATLDVSGTDLTAGTLLNCNALATSYISVDRISDTQAVTAFINGTSTFVNVQILDISGTVITNTGTTAIPSASASTYSWLTVLSSSKAMVAWTDSTFLKARLLDISGSNMSNGSSVVKTINTSATTWKGLTMLSSTQALCAYTGASTFLQAKLLGSDGTDVTFTADSIAAGTTLHLANGVGPDSTAIQLDVVATAKTFTRVDGGSFIMDGFTSGMTTVISGFTNAGNNGTKTISTVTASTLTMSVSTGLVDETGGGDERALTVKVVTGEYVFGTGIGGNATITGVDSATNIVTVDNAHTATVTGYARVNALPLETVADSSVGFPLKVRVRTTTPNVTGIASLYFFTKNTAASRANTFPLDTYTLSLTGLQTGTKIAVLETGTETLLEILTESGGTISYTYENDLVGTAVDLAILAPEFLYQKITNYTLTSEAATIPIVQNADYGYDDAITATVTFNGATKRIICDAATTTISVIGVYTEWVNWALTSDNLKYNPAFSELGGNTIDAGAGTSVPVYGFLINTWRISPDEADHTLAVTGGIILVDGGGDPFVDTVGDFTVRINYQQPVQAIVVSISTGSGLSVEQDEQLMKTLTVGKFLGLK
ncbi:MAG: Synechococcus virus Syn5 [Candidatus Parcubacteria bacterium]|jgi:hypothetical protein